MGVTENHRPGAEYEVDVLPPVDVPDPTTPATGDDEVGVFRQAHRARRPAGHRLFGARDELVVPAPSHLVDHRSIPPSRAASGLTQPGLYRADRLDVLAAQGAVNVPKRFDQQRMNPGVGGQDLAAVEV